jgi:aldose 1-epimerase
MFERSLNYKGPALAAISTLLCCVLAPAAQGAVVAELLGRVGDEKVEIYTLTNAHGIEARIMTYGASIVSLKTPDRDGHFCNVVLGFDSLDPYLAGVPYYGATVGRYANRIAKGQFTLDGATHQLPLNDGPNSLHGGRRGFDKRIWKADAVAGTAHNTLRLTYVSPDGEEGFPGELTAHVTYRLSDEDSLTIEYEATTTAATPVNLANHAYFNLTGNPQHPILDHVLTIHADKFTPVDSTLIPTGELRSVTGTPFDFRKPHAIGSRIDAGDVQLALGKGYDHNWVLNGDHGKLPRLAAVLTDPGSGRSMEVLTTQPGVQFYTGNFMNGQPAGHGSVFAYRTGLCLETQHFPDSPNRPSFPSTILHPGETYFEKTVLHFATVKAAGEHR